MRDRSIVPTNLLAWPRCARLLPEHRLILLWLWAAPYMSCAGVGLVPIKAAAATLGLDPYAMEGGLENLQQAGLIDLDLATGEVFVVDWFRFHKFDNGRARGTLKCAVEKVESERLRNVILEKSRPYFPTATTTTTTTSLLPSLPLPTSKGGMEGGREDSSQVQGNPIPRKQRDGDRAAEEGRQVEISGRAAEHRALIASVAAEAGLTHEQHQQLADEMAGRLADTQQRPIAVPRSWLEKAAQSIAAGGVTQYGQAVATARRRRADERAAAEARRAEAEAFASAPRLSKAELDARLSGVFKRLS